MSNSDNLKLRDMETPMVLGYELDRRTLLPVRRPINPTIHEPVAIIEPVIFKFFPPDPNPSSGILSDITGLASGTLASLSKESNYNKIEIFHAKLVEFYFDHFDTEWTTWHDVWFSYSQQTEKTS